MHVIPDEGESVRLNENSNPSEFTYHKKYANTYTSAYDRVLKALKNLDTFYNPTMPGMHGPVIEEKYKVTGDTIVILIVEHEEEKIQWVCSMSIYMNTGKTETLKEVMTRPNEN